MSNDKITKADLSRMVREAINIGKVGAVPAERKQEFDSVFDMAWEMLSEKEALTVERIKERLAESEDGDEKEVQPAKKHKTAHPTPRKTKSPPPSIE